MKLDKWSFDLAMGMQKDFSEEVVILRLGG